MTMRTTREVLKDMLEAREIVREYPAGVLRTATTVDKLLPGIAAFGVGTGLACDPWRKLFPIDPIQFVAHNWGNPRMLLKSQKCGGEAGEVFWRRLFDFHDRAEINLQNTQTINVLQGIKAGPAAGTMSTDKTFLGECLAYLREQVHIVRPRLIVTLGEASAYLCRKANREHKFGVEIVSIMHPSARARNWAGPYDAWIETQARTIREALR